MKCRHLDDRTRNGIKLLDRSFGHRRFPHGGKRRILPAGPGIFRRRALAQSRPGAGGMDRLDAAPPASATARYTLFTSPPENPSD
jgi:hypothetical protein